MTVVAPSLPAFPPRPATRSWVAEALLLLAVAVAVRLPLFGNPLIHSDEGFYLLVGDRMLQGAWPFVDIFDRKPAGLFLIYAAIRSLGGDGILVYQMAATLCAAATAMLVTRMARRFASPDSALAAGVLYLAWLLIFDGGGGQSSVWYGLPMAGAGLLALDGMRARERIGQRGAAAMLLVGVAMQIKYTALFEGVFFAVALLWARWRRDGRLSVVAADAAAWMALALAPTALAWGVYAVAGHGEAFLFANFLSIFGQRDADTHADNLLKLAEAAALAAPLSWLAWRGRAVDRPVVGWVVAALVAIVLMRSFEQHYVIPLMLPLATAAAAGLERREDGGRLSWRRFQAVLLIGVLMATLVTGLRIRQRGTPAQAARLAALVGDRPAGCMFGFNSEPILYYLTRSCLPTPYVFRSHLGQTIEAKGIGVDPLAEVARVLATRPGTIVVRARKRTTHPGTEALVTAAIAARYRLVGAVRIGRLDQRVYKLRATAR